MDRETTTRRRCILKKLGVCSFLLKINVVLPFKGCRHHVIAFRRLLAYNNNNNKICI